MVDVIVVVDAHCLSVFAAREVTLTINKKTLLLNSSIGFEFLEFSIIIVLVIYGVIAKTRNEIMLWG